MHCPLLFPLARQARRHAQIALLALFSAHSLSAQLWTTPSRTEGDWKEISWLGWISEAENNWIYHAQHGWLYAAGTSEDSVWFWDLEMGWLWSGVHSYPYLYQSTGDTWLFYYETEASPRYFYHFAAGDWATLYPMEPAPVSHSTESWDWLHQDFVETEEHQLLSYNNSTSSKTFELTVVENDWIRIKLLPQWGGRVLSIYSKALDFEMLYYPRHGERSEMIAVDDAFYYDWILLPYGINPTFPEGEHGKFWGTDWPLELIEENDNQITFRMSMVDDVDWPDRPWNFNNGRTDLHVAMDVTVYRDRSYLDIEYTLTNTRDESVAYEFWTPAGFAPIRESDTQIPADTEIVMNHDEIIVKDWWNWIKQTETNIGARNDDIMLFDKLRHLSNWQGSGIAYAYPVLEIPWFGVINHQDGFGAMRTADDPNAAPGMKIWATGDDSLMFELWSGHNPEFFVDEFMEPLEVKNWHEYYLPFADLSHVSHATKYGVIQADFRSTESEEFLELKVTSTMPSEVWKVSLSTNLGGAQMPTAECLISFDATGAPVDKIVPLTGVDDPALQSWLVTVTEAFTGEERMVFDLTP